MACYYGAARDTERPSQLETVGDWEHGDIGDERHRMFFCPCGPAHSGQVPPALPCASLCVKLTLLLISPRWREPMYISSFLPSYLILIILCF